MSVAVLEAAKLYTDKHVQQIGVRAWQVLGVREAGDVRAVYIVAQAGANYTCSCQNGLLQEVCRHILAVVRWRENHPIPPVSSPLFEDKLGPLPAHVKELRPYQWQAIQEIVDHFNAGKRVVIFEGPTGIGKTVVGEATRRVLGARSIYLCVDISLQKQFVRDFPYAALIMGRSNYPTLDYPERFYLPGDNLSCDDCDKQRINDEEVVCSWCSNVYACPYQVAKRTAMNSPLAVANLAYWIAEIQFGQKAFAKRELVIIDEADELESIIMSAVEVRVGPRQMESLRIGPPEKKTVPESWDEWVQNVALPAVSARLATLKEMVEELPFGSPVRLRSVREIRGLERLYAGLKRVENGRVKDGNWVYAPDRDGAVVFKPIRVAEDAREIVWTNGEKFLLMSGTICAPDIYAQELGLEEDEWAFVHVPSPFPKENRPIYVVPRANITRKTKADEIGVLVATIDQIIDRYPNDRVLVHAVSYDLTRDIVANSRHQGRMITYNSARERFSALARYEATPGAVLVAPSMERGVDLRDDLCRCVIIAKIPYPNLGDRQVAARAYSRGGQAWYILQTVRTIVQMCGRGVRSATDYCDIYIVDRQFMEFRRRAWRMFPAWWREAVVWHDKPTIRATIA